MVTVDWEGRRVEAADPPLLADRTFDLTATTVRRTEQAAGAVRELRHVGHGLEVVGRLLLRGEGVASSAIEGLRASPAEVAAAEASGTTDGSTAAWVADNLAVLDEALATKGRLTVARLHRWHRRLMRNSPPMDPRHVGAWRDVLAWVGGANPLVAAHVGAPPSAIPRLMDDVIAFDARDDVDAVTQAAVAHAQLETIHPYADGNGRIGRVLISRTLSRRLGISCPPPVSLVVARDVGGYQAGLTLYREGSVDAWVRWFATAVAAAATRTVEVYGAASDLIRAWEADLAGLRSDAAARRVLAVLAQHPLIDVTTGVAATGASREAVRLGLEALADRGIVVELELEPRRAGPGRPQRRWLAEELLALVAR